MNLINLGEVAVCSEATVLPLNADTTGLWAFVSNFNGAYQYKQFQATNEEPIIVPARLNENYTYTVKLYKPDNSLFNDSGYTIKTVPMLPDVEYDCSDAEGSGLSEIKSGRKQFIAGNGQTVFVDAVFKNAKQVMVFVEGALRQEGAGEDEYVFDTVAGSISFNSPMIEQQKITVLYIR